MRTGLRRGALALGLVAAGLGGPAAADGTGTCGVTGTAFLDADRSGSRSPGEAGRAGDVVHVFDATGTYVRGATTDAAGGYAVTGLACAPHRVAYAPTSWWALRDTHVPTTTGSLRPEVDVALTGLATVDLGWRAITRSTTAGQPVTAHTGPEGLRVESYDDVVPAAALHALLLTGTVGAEAGSVVVRFDLGGTSTTATSVGATAGRYDRFSAVSTVAWDAWLDGPEVLAHEYGHAWAMHRAYLVQQDPTLSGYLQARGLTGDPRLGTSHAWGRDELLAEDYRQLLGPPAARAAAQANTAVPAAAAVPGLREHLLGAFSVGTAPTPSPSASPTAGPSPVASPTAGPSPVASPTPSPTVSPAPTPSPTVSSRKGGGCRRC